MRIATRTQDALREMLPVLVLSLVFALLYLYASVLSENSILSRQARFEVDTPFKFRFVLPYLLGLILTDQQLDAKWLKVFAATLSTTACLVLLPRFFERLTRIKPDSSTVQQLQLGTLTILVLHYCVPRELNIYYFNDLPAIALYLACFLLLTRSSRIPLSAALVSVAASLNRETVVIALFHAAGFHLTSVLTPPKAERRRALVRLALIGVTIALVRLAVNYVLDSDLTANAVPMVGERMRFAANLDRVLRDNHAAVRLPMIGFGLILWLPLVFWRLPREVRYAHLWSLPPLAVLVWAGNFTELRIYSELVPLWVVSFAWLWPGPPKSSDGARAVTASLGTIAATIRIAITSRISFTAVPAWRANPTP